MIVIKLLILSILGGRSNCQNDSPAPLSPAIPSDALTGNDFLFDLAADRLESKNLFYKDEYVKVIHKLAVKVNEWKSEMGLSDVPDDTVKSVAWSAAGKQVVPWLDDNYQRKITQKYAYKKAPNIVVILVDDWGINDVGYQSTYLNWTTPNIDALAASGIKLTNYYTHELCVPSRAALMTGRYAFRFGMHDAGNEETELPIREVTLAEELKSAGYRTNLIGKWHLGVSSQSRTPNNRGFDYSYGYMNGFIDYWTKKYGHFEDFHENSLPVVDSEALSPEVHSETLFAAKAVEIIEDHAKYHSDQPMFMYFASQLLHTEWAAPVEYINRCAESNSVASANAKLYCAMNLMLDDVVANITCALGANNMAENTLIVLMSDNGGSQLMNGATFPYRGAKGSFWQGAVTVPAFVYGSDKFIPTKLRGTEYDGIVHVTDWLPTLMGLATNGEWTGGYNDATIDGSDIWRAITTNMKSPHTEIVHYLDQYGNFSYQLGDTKWVHSIQDDDFVLLQPIPPDYVFTNDKEPVTACMFDGFVADKSILTGVLGFLVGTTASESSERSAADLSVARMVATPASTYVLLFLICGIAFALVVSPMLSKLTLNRSGSSSKYATQDTAGIYSNAAAGYGSSSPVFIPKTASTDYSAVEDGSEYDDLKIPRVYQQGSLSNGTSVDGAHEHYLRAKDASR